MQTQKCSQNQAFIYAKTSKLPSHDHEKWNLSFKASKITKMNAELGALRATVIPQPRYSPFSPYCRQIARPSLKNRALGLVECTEQVCMRDLMVSAGKKRKL
jgi:hypothetical protein